MARRIIPDEVIAARRFAAGGEQGGVVTSIFAGDTGKRTLKIERLIRL